jgi:hypothetical protein
VVLISFTGAQKGENIELQWSTASEINNAYFELQRSFDGKNFSGIIKIKGQGSTSRRSVYRYEDAHVLTGQNNVYYRLVQTDINGKSALSGTVVVNNRSITSATLIQVTPNPFCSTAQLQLSTAKAGLVEIRIMDLNGRVYSNRSLELGAGSHVIPLSELESLNNTGIYFLQVITSEETVTERIVKTN